jgi:hypothetical protein
MRKKLSSFLAALVVALFFVSCQNQSTNQIDTQLSQPTSPARVTAEASNGYPGPQTTNSGYPEPSTIDQDAIITRTPDPTLNPDKPVPTPQSGMVTVTGHVILSETNEPIANIPVSLAEVYRNAENQGAFAYDSAASPTTLTDSRGRFILANVEPKEYVIVVGNVEVNKYEILADETGDARVWQTPADEIFDTGEIQVDIDWQG